MDEVEEVIDSMEGLSEDVKALIHQSIAQVLESGACGKQEDLDQILKSKGVHLSQQCLAGYLTWISDHYQDHPELHLPQILYDKDTTEFFDVS